MKILGIDNVFFQIGNLEKAIEFYQKLGFELKLRFSHISSVLFEIGKKEPGLILQETKPCKPSKLWVKIPNAMNAKEECETAHIHGKLLEIPTGLTFEVTDPWENVIGFADYSKKSELEHLR